MKKFIIVRQFGSGYKQYKCLKCGNVIAIPVDAKDENIIWCYYCDNTEKKEGL